MRALTLLLLAFPAAAAPERVATTARLSNGEWLPLVGVGVGNLPHEQLAAVLGEAVGDHGVRFVDTAAASRNERAIADALAPLAVAAPGSVVVQTKVWYTHLGYARTRLSVEDSLAALSPDAARNVTVLLHWPRCRDDIPWMRCEAEEAELPERVKQAGPPPHLDRERAWTLERARVVV